MPLSSTGPVIAAVIIGQPESVVRHAAVLALSFGSELLCASVDTTGFTQRDDRDGKERFIPIDPDAVTVSDQETVDRLRQEVKRNMSGIEVAWSLRSLAGDPARELSILADRVNASTIVVGTRRPGLGKRLGELVEGSVAVHLAHHQSRPVLVIPLHPRPFRTPH
jgi:nucleotide-binding universal stress UspA family protein